MQQELSEPEKELYRDKSEMEQDSRNHKEEELGAAEEEEREIYEETDDPEVRFVFAFNPFPFQSFFSFYIIKSKISNIFFLIPRHSFNSKVKTHLVKKFLVIIHHKVSSPYAQKSMILFNREVIYSSSRPHIILL